MGAIYLGLTLVDFLIRLALVAFIAEYSAFSLGMESILSVVTAVGAFGIMAAIPYQPYPFNKPANENAYWKAWAKNWITMLVITFIVFVIAILAGATAR